MEMNSRKFTARLTPRSSTVDPNPRISEWPRPETDTSEASSGCAQLKQMWFCQVSP